MVGLERLPDGHIDHTSDGVNSKDQADAFCGAMYLAGQFADEYSYSYGESLESALIINMEDSNTYKKHQMIADFEAELSKCSILETPDDHTVDPEKKEEIQRYQDISDGIIII